MKMEITRLAIAQLSKDDDRYQEKLATFYRMPDFGMTQSMTVGSNLNPFSKEKRLGCNTSQYKGFTSIATKHAVLERCCSS